MALMVTRRAGEHVLIGKHVLVTIVWHDKKEVLARIENTKTGKFIDRCVKYNTEKLSLGNGVLVFFSDAKPSRIRVGIIAPKDMPILRNNLLKEKR